MFFKGLIQPALSILRCIARCKIDMNPYHSFSKKFHKRLFCYFRKLNTFHLT
jgi:hypothetical protein